MKYIGFVAAALVTPVLANSFESPLKPEGVLISGEELITPYVAELEVTTQENVTHTKMIPGTYTLRNGIYLLPNGTCVERKTELVKMERTEGNGGYIETPTIKHTSTSINCPAD